MEEGSHVTVLPHAGTNAPCPGGGAGLGASATPQSEWEARS